MILVFAGSYVQARDWAYAKQIDFSEFVYVDRYDRILGCRDQEYVLIGEYYKDKEWYKISQQLLVGRHTELNPDTLEEIKK